MRSKAVTQIALAIGIVAESLWHAVCRRFEPASEPFFWLDARARAAAIERDAIPLDRGES